LYARSWLGARVFGVSRVLVPLGRVLVAQGLARKDPRFEFHERGGHDEELARELDVDRVELREKAHVLLGDRRDRDVVQVDLVAPDQVQEQIHGAFERVEPHAVVLAHGPIVAWRTYHAP